MYAVYGVDVAWSDSGSIIGSNISIPISMQASSYDRFYLNTARPAPCNGSITRFGYCYYGRPDNGRETYQALVSVYRPMAAGNGFMNIMNAVPIIKRTPISQVPLVDALLPGFNCDSIELGASVQVLEGDVIGVCLSSDDGLRQLDVVSESMNNGYRMLYINAFDCASLLGIVLRETAESDDSLVLRELAENLILHTLGCLRETILSLCLFRHAHVVKINIKVKRMLNPFNDN